MLNELRQVKIVTKQNKHCINNHIYNLEKKILISICGFPIIFKNYFNHGIQKTLKYHILNI